jgi:hypothetical protein
LRSEVNVGDVSSSNGESGTKLPQQRRTTSNVHISYQK